MALRPAPDGNDAEMVIGAVRVPVVLDDGNPFVPSVVPRYRPPAAALDQLAYTVASPLIGETGGASRR